MPIDEGQACLRAVADQVSRVVIGKQQAVQWVVVALLAGGHCLIEDVPGVGKTLLARAVARTLGCEIRRIQFTPDLLPSDITGSLVYRADTGSFRFRPGPLFAHVVLADEINRTSPRTQSALLEAMEEGAVTVDGETHLLPSPFFVLATQNPVELDGTFPLPEAQLDRFYLRIAMGYPSPEEEVSILERPASGRVGAAEVDALPALASPAAVLAWRRLVEQVHVDLALRRYMVDLVGATRAHPAVQLGASPRASIALFRCAQALAFWHGRDYVVPDDIGQLAGPVLEHRIRLTASARWAGQSAAEVVRDALRAVPVPAGGTGAKAGLARAAQARPGASV
ncbi:MAG: MoxR family ATPase [Alicyclobacillaceae bacterium]|nr:MoxR family ATPase [Alicyclobacillaceae bacterium]